MTVRATIGPVKATANISIEVQDQRTLDIGLFLNLVKDCRGFHFGLCNGLIDRVLSLHSCISWGYRSSDLARVDIPLCRHQSPLLRTFYQSKQRDEPGSTCATNYVRFKQELPLTSRDLGSSIASHGLALERYWSLRKFCIREDRETNQLGFPETIDKLGPEIGRYSGPRPVMFREYSINNTIPLLMLIVSVHCEPSVLASSNIGQSNTSNRTAEFGAEQVILVHDDAAKARLQAEVGNVALILTILQSKGMEFDDVVLWNFFTDCPYPAGLRSLATLDGKDATTTFDARKHLVRNQYHRY